MVDAQQIEQQEDYAAFIARLGQFTEHFRQLLGEAGARLEKANNYIDNGNLSAAQEEAAGVQRLLTQAKPGLEGMLGDEAVKSDTLARQELEELAAATALHLTDSCMLQATTYCTAGVEGYDPLGKEVLKDEAKKDLEAAVQKCQEAHNAFAQLDGLVAEPRKGLALWRGLKLVYNIRAYSASMLGSSAYNLGNRRLGEAASMPDDAGREQKFTSGTESMGRALSWCELVLETYQNAAKIGVELHEQPMLLAERTSFAIVKRLKGATDA